jgi:hypothetical protein
MKLFRSLLSSAPAHVTTQSPFMRPPADSTSVESYAGIRALTAMRDAGYPDDPMQVVEVVMHATIAAVRDYDSLMKECDERNQKMRAEIEASMRDLPDGYEPPR